MRKALPSAASRPRLSSIDALRGFVMFWIMGADQIAPLLAKASPGPFIESLAHQFDHVPWHGLVFYDLIFPTFMFLAGTSLAFSSRNDDYAKVFLRAAFLVILGFIFNGALKFRGLENFRWPGVLQRIGITYYFGALIFMRFDLRGRIAWVLALLLGYWAILALVPVPGIGAGVLTPEGNLTGYVDRMFLYGRMCCYSFGDNEGILSTIPAITTVVLGTFAGTWLKSSAPAQKKAQGLALAGLAAVIAGYAWNPHFPLNKILWTSSFALAAAGYSALMLAFIYWLMEIQGFKTWAFAFVLIGMNSITIYLGQEIIDFNGIAKFFVGGLASRAGEFGGLISVAGTLAAKIGFLYLLWRQKWFLKV